VLATTSRSIGAVGITEARMTYDAASGTVDSRTMGYTAASKTNFGSMPQLMAAEGWIVFQPNDRGSDNLGNAY